MLRKSLAFAAAASLAAAPALAQSGPASSIAPAATVRAGPTGQADSSLEGGFGLPAIVFVAIVIAGVLLATGVLYDDNHPPTSP